MIRLLPPHPPKNKNKESLTSLHSFFLVDFHHSQSIFSRTIFSRCFAEKPAISIHHHFHKFPGLCWYGQLKAIRRLQRLGAQRFHRLCCKAPSNAREIHHGEQVPWWRNRWNGGQTGRGLINNTWLMLKVCVEKKWDAGWRFVMHQNGWDIKCVYLCFLAFFKISVWFIQHGERRISWKWFFGPRCKLAWPHHWGLWWKRPSCCTLSVKLRTLAKNSVFFVERFALSQGETGLNLLGVIFIPPKKSKMDLMEWKVQTAMAKQRII